MEENQKSKSQLINELQEVSQLVTDLRDELVRRDEAEAELRKLAHNLEVQVDDFTREIQREISQREKAEEALAEERNLLRTLIDNLPDLIYVKDIEHRFLLVNNAFLPLMGVSKQEDLIGKMDSDYFPEQLARQYYEDEEKIMKTGTPMINREERTINKSTNAEVWLLSTKIPLHDSKGNIIGLVGVNRDITKRKTQ